MNEGNEAQLNKLKAQVNKLDTVLDDVEKSRGAKSGCYTVLALKN